MNEEFARKRYMKEYLDEVSTLLSRRVHVDEVLSLAETEGVREAAKKRASPSVRRWEVPFDARTSPRFSMLVDALEKSSPEKVYLWCPLTNVCGLLPPVPIREVNFQFPFEINREGMIVLLGQDLSNKLLLDFSEDEGRRTMEVELSGPQWGAIEF